MGAPSGPTSPEGGPRRITRRRFIQISAGSAAAAALAACTGSGTRGAPPGSPSVDRMLRTLGSDAVRAMQRGYVPGRSGEILLVPKPRNVVAQWPDGISRIRDTRTTHAAPWDYLMRVPIMLHGPGYIRPGVISDRSVDVADLPATFADLMGFGFEAPDGSVLDEALLPRPQRNGTPRVILLVAYDGGGWNVLEQWPDAWPNQRRLAVEGATYLNATIGSSPPVTAPVHATMGTGAYPRRHKMAKNTGRLPDGSIGDSFLGRADPALLEAETIADAWSRDRDHRPWVGMLAYESWHLGMMGKGARAQGGDRDPAVLWDRDAMEFWTNREIYSLPTYLPGRRALDRRVDALITTEPWMSSSIADDVYIPGTPAFIDHQGEALLKMLAREPIGTGPDTSLLFLELKPSDTGGHLWNMLSERMGSIIRAQDRLLGSLVRALDAKVGPDGYVLAITADHGQSPRPDAVDGRRIDRFRLQANVNDHFGADVLETAHPDDVFVDREVLRDLGLSLENLARFLVDLRFEDVAPEGTDLAALPRSVVEDRVFAAAIPGEAIARLTQAEIRALGRGKYPEGDLTSSVPRYADLLSR